MYNAVKMAELDTILIRNDLNLNITAMRILLMLHPGKQPIEIPESILLAEYAALYFVATTPSAAMLLM